MVGDLTESVQWEAGDEGLEAAGKRVHRVAPPLPGENQSAKNSLEMHDTKNAAERKKKIPNQLIAPGACKGGQCVVGAL